MDNGERTFGELLTYLREQKDVTLRELAPVRSITVI